MPSSITSLPQELVDQILDDIGAGDKRAAASCALTCNSWTPRSSKHLFHSVNVFTTHLQEFLAQAKGSSRLASHVANFSISQPLHGHDGFDLTPFVHDILRTLPNLRNLSVFGERISLRSCLSPVSGGRRYDLTLLRLSSVHVEALPELLSLFDHIGTLYLDQAYIPAPLGSSTAKQHHLRVDALHCDTSLSALEPLWLSLAKDSLKILCLKCDGYFRIETAPVNAFLQFVGQSLEHFRLDLPIDGWVVAGPGEYILWHMFISKS
jgi:hypothetical protein